MNATELHNALTADGVRLQTSTDSEVMTHLIARSPGSTILEKLSVALPQLEGAFSLAILTPTRIVAVRDPNGIRPLCLGRLDDGWVVASETCALATVGARFEREIEPGEIVSISASGVHSTSIERLSRSKLCVFELIYFARPDSMMRGERLYLVRQRMGAELAREQPVDADVVVGIPDSATPAAIGFARESGIPYSEGLIKNRYIGRTFIQPDQRLREVGVRLKLNALPEVVEGKRVVLVDDTIVRGTTSRPVVNLIRDAGAKEVHMRVHAPPVVWPCFLGVDMATREELIAANKTIDEIREVINADSLGYLSLDGLFKAIGQPSDQFCSACLTGTYPVDISGVAGKMALERAVT